MNVRGIGYLGLEGLVFLKRTRLGDHSLTNDGTVLTIETEGNLTASCRGGSDVELLGTLAEIHTTELDELSVVDVVDIHILDIYLGTLQSVAPGHRLSLYTLIGIQP